MTEEEKKEEPEKVVTHEQKRLESQQKNLQDENSIKVLNANFTVKASKIPEGDKDQVQLHLGEEITTLIDMIGGVQTHLDTEFIIVKEKMRDAYNNTTIVWDKDHSEIVNAKEILTTVAQVGLDGVRAAFNDLGWTESQMEFMFKLIREQHPTSIKEKVKNAPKGALKTPGKVVGKVLEVTHLKKGKYQVK